MLHISGKDDVISSTPLNRILCKKNREGEKGTLLARVVFSTKSVCVSHDYKRPSTLTMPLIDPHVESFYAQNPRIFTPRSQERVRGLMMSLIVSWRE